MKRSLQLGLAALATVGFLAPTSHAQSNTIAGLDVILGLLDGLDDEGRTGTFPNGRNGFAMSTTSCNAGTVTAAWEAAMDPDHPFICFIMARESGGRLVQISNYSRVKHGFFALSSNQCGFGCAGTDGTELGIGCSDTYGIGTNAGRNNLGPPEEIDPWLGEWNRTCSLFDGPNCDNNRSYFGSEPNGVIGRVEVEDSDLDVAGARFIYYSNYIVEHEAEANRNNNQGWNDATITWNGSGYNVSVAGGGGTPTYGTLLDAWTGATVNSATNGTSDGRVYVASRTAPAGPNTRYEYAVHNRDNFRAVGEFRVPIAPGTNVTNFGFHDVDQDAGNDWTASVVGNEVVFTTATNPIRWNSFYNFWFDADSSATNSAVTIDQFFGGGGAPSFAVNAITPGGGMVDPCAGPDDSLEPNDSCAAANVQGDGFDGGLFVEKTDEDWYRISVNDGDTLTLTTSFSHANGDIDVELFDACGGTQVDSGATATDNEQVTVTNTSGGTIEYRARVFVFANSASDCNNYDLDISITGPPMGCQNADALEPNDSCAGSGLLTDGSYPNLTLQDNNDDWYEVELAPGQTLSATMNFLDANGDLDMFLFASCGGGTIDTSESTSNSENVGVTNNTGSTQDYFIRCFVWNDNVPCNDYDLTISVTGGDPCALLPADAFEENDSCGAAATLGAGLQQNLNVSKTDDDWFEVVVPAAATIDVDCLHLVSEADVDLFLLDACGGNQLDSGETGSNNENVSWTNLTAGSVTAKIRVEVWPNSAGDCANYDLDITVSGGDPCLVQPADSFEENDTCATAAAIGTGLESNLTVSKTDEDWYSIVVPNLATIDTLAIFSHATADVDTFLFDACGGTQLDDGFSADDDEVMNWVNNTGSAVTVRIQVNVFAGSTGDCNDYDLDITITPGAPTNLIPFCFGDGSGTGCPCGNNSTFGHPGGCANSAGDGAVLIATGNPSVANDTLSITATGGVPFSLGVLFSGNNQLGGGNGILGMPQTDGLRCIGGGLQRHGNRVITASGTPNLPWGDGGGPAGGLIANGGFTAGQTRNFALTYRDFDTLVCNSGLNTTNAIEVLIEP